MKELVTILGVWAIANVIVGILALHKKYPVLNFKPINCELCLTWWIGLAVLIPKYGFDGILYSAIATMINYYTYDPRRF
jgi:hypothetical protein